MNTIVTKFGGSSLADANQIKKVKDILYSNFLRKYCIASAAGKRNSEDDKITDLLILLFNNRNNENKQQEIINKILSRYKSIVDELNIDFDVENEIKRIISESKNKRTVDYLASRGEYLSSKILSIYLNAHFLDMQDIIIFDDDKKVDYEITYKNINNAIEKIRANDKDKIIVIPGFYGSNKNGEIVTFSRGGSDITGSIIARVVEADLYENWTDVSGVLFADPRLVDNPKVVDYITYSEFRELSYMGASVLHEEAVFPISKVGIPINILNTNKPQDKGTMIVSNIPSVVKRGVVTGIAGLKGFTSVLLQKSLMNEEIGFFVKLLKIFERERISVEHCPTGIDTISVIVRNDLFKEKKDVVLNNIKQELHPDVLTIEDNIAIIAIVGEGMIYSKGIIADVFSLLKEANISVKMIDQGSSGINLIIGVLEKDYEKAMKTLSLLQNISH